MLQQGLILTSHRDYAHTMRAVLLELGLYLSRVDIEMDALRAMQLVPQQYGLILIDTMLDAMDGLQLLQLLKQQAPGSKFIVVSDASDETSRAYAYQNGADLFLPRPRTPQALQKASDDIAALLNSGRHTQPLPQDEDSPAVKLADLMQTRCLSGDTVLLLVRGKSQSGDIFVYQGEVFHAQYPGRSGEGAFYDMCQWDDGLVRVRALKLNHVPPRTIEIPYKKLLEKARNSGQPVRDLRVETGELRLVSKQAPSDSSLPEVMIEAPPLEELWEPPARPEAEQAPDLSAADGTPLPRVNAHWKVNLMGELVESSQVAESGRCAFITYFIYRKLADIAVALEVDYFTHLTLTGEHLQQVLVADNMGVRHAVFDTAWTTEADREQFVKWCCEQSF